MWGQIKSEKFKFLCIINKQKLFIPILIDFFIFILLSQESEKALCIGRIQTCLRVAFVSEFSVRVLLLTFNLQFVRFHQADIIIVTSRYGGSWTIGLCSKSLRHAAEQSFITSLLVAKAQKIMLCIFLGLILRFTI